jgi:hypothetical protein
VAEFVEIADGPVRWRFERDFLESNWQCIWGDGCHGIASVRNAEAALGCCSLGADLDGIDEARLVAALAAALPAEQFQFHDHAERVGIFSDASRTNTAVVDGGCVFLNRPGFSGGAGCALHLAALAAGESPRDWKPSVCWQLPVKVDWEPVGDDTEVATVRRWARRDWGDDGVAMAWCCTEETEAYRGDRTVIDSLAGEIEEIVGTTVFVELRQRLSDPDRG